jgi:hypothetical protein
MNTLNDLHSFIEKSAKRHGLFEHILVIKSYYNICRTPAGAKETPLLEL